MSHGADKARDGSLPPYVAVILDQPAIGPEWKSWLTHELALRGVLLDTNGNLEEDGLILGFFRFLEPPETEVVLRAANVAVAAHECPWAGPMRGALGWVRAGLEEELLRSFLPLLVRLGRGPLIRTADGAHHEPFRKVTFSLGNLLDKYGFEDGEAFLDRTPDYLEYARREVQASLARVGLEAQVSRVETAHNPLRIRGPVLRHGKPVSEEVLRELSVTLWAHDWSCLQDVTFW